MQPNLRIALILIVVATAGGAGYKYLRVQSHETVPGYPGRLGYDQSTGVIAKGPALYLEVAGAGIVFEASARSNAIGRTAKLVLYDGNINVPPGRLLGNPVRIELDGGGPVEGLTLHLVADGNRYLSSPEGFVFCTLSDRLMGNTQPPGYGIHSPQDTDRRIGRLVTKTEDGVIHAIVPYGPGPVYFLMRAAPEGRRGLP